MTRPVSTHVIGGQNMTEGRVTAAIKACDIVIGQEIKRWRIRLGLRGFKHWFPARDKHQSISARKDSFVITNLGYDQFHKSGTAEHLGFKTPARGMIWVTGYFVDAPAEIWFIGGVWLVNSWAKTGTKADRTTPGRLHLVLERSIPVIEKRVAWATRKGMRIYVEGDWNDIRKMTPVAGLHFVVDDGLDKAAVGRNDLVDLVSHTTGPKTGVGPDLEHRALIATVRSRRTP